MKKYLKILSLTVLLSNLNATEVYSVDELIVQALKNSPNLHISSASYKASKYKIDQTNASYLPSVDLALSIGESGMSDIPLNPDSMVSDTFLMGKLSLKQLVYDFGKTDASSENAKYSAQTYLNDYQQLISDKKLNVKSAYFNVLQKIALIKVNKENVKLNKAQLYRSQKYFDAGIRTKIDVSDAKVELIKSKIDLKNSQYDLQLAYTQLDKEIGIRAFKSDYKVLSKDLDLTKLYDSLQEYTFTLEESVDFAYKNRYEIKKQVASLNVSKSEIQSAKSEYYPSIYFNANYTKQKLDTFKNALPQDQWQALFNLDMNLYRGGETDAKNEEKIINVEIANANIVNTKLLIKAQTTQAYINVNKAKDSVKLSQSLLTVSNEKFHQASQRYEHGLSDFIELQQARQGYIDSMASLVITYYSYYNSIAILDNAIGH